jgi:hypothetical protein
MHPRAWSGQQQLRRVCSGWRGGVAGTGGATAAGGW